MWDTWKFNEKLWDPTLYALQLLQDFVTTDWVTDATGVPPNRPDWTEIIPFPPPMPAAAPFTFLMVREPTKPKPYSVHRARS